MLVLPSNKMAPLIGNYIADIKNHHCYYVTVKIPNHTNNIKVKHLQEFIEFHQYNKTRVDYEVS